ncbi:hypothetical protein GGI19_000650 [Coemansia pectinata]|uniref:Mediator of RNA polymerase II transcription subunit 17 n=1 Tax=Coemansia pectinata TaxID=1052879 RepID=A0A9W8LBZ7_9FUNG|nr:hypothetical protein GGI19_000650 [Coemansia pectinata]
MPSGTLRAPLESMASQFTVNEIDAQGSVTLQPHLSAQEEMAQQIGQLWDTYNNFQGLPDLPDTTSDIDNDTESKASDEEDSVDLLTTTAVNGKSDEKRGADMDAYAVRAKVHEQLTLAQSEIQVSLDMVRLLLAAKKRAARGGVSGEQAALAKHDQATGSTAFAALVGGDIGTEVTVGGLPFPVGMVDTVKTERRAQTSSEQQTNELKFVLGAKYRQMGEAADTLLLSSQRLQTMARGESGFWRTAFELRRRNWVVQQQRQLMGASSKRMPLYGDRYFARYGYADAGSSFSEDGLAEILRPSDDSPPADDNDVVMQSPPESVASQLTPLKQGVKAAPLFIPSSDRRRLQVRLFGDEQNAPPGLAGSSDYCGSPLHPSALDRTHARLLGARRALFDRELYHRLCKEARVLDLGSVRSTVTSADPPLIRDILVTTLSRDNMDVRFEWMLDDSVSSECPGSEFVAWQSEYYAGLALVMAAMHQRRLHREVKQHYLGANLASRAHVAATSGRAPLPPPDAFANAPAVPTSAPPLMAQSQVATGAATPSGVSAAPSGSETAAGGSGSGSPAAAAVVAGSAESSTAAEATGAGTTYSVARSDLLILAPVLQGMQFAKWQHILSAHTQRACAAWRQLTGEPIEVITHFARSYQTPDGEWSARDTRNLRQLYTTPSTDDDGASSEGMAYVIRMRFQGGSIMAFRVDSLGNLVFIKGYFPLSKDSVLSQPDQISIHRVFRIIPMAGLSEFVDQLRREMQSLVLLRVASALSRCSYQRVGKRCQMGQWYVHQAQLCAVGECWEGARHRQIIAVPCWGEDTAAVPAAGLGDSADSTAWRLSLAFGPKHPTAFDAIPHSVGNGSDRPRVPWTTVYPPTPDSPMALQISHLKTFEERLLQVLVSSF